MQVGTEAGWGTPKTVNFTYGTESTVLTIAKKCKFDCFIFVHGFYFVPWILKNPYLIIIYIYIKICFFENDKLKII